MFLGQDQQKKKRGGTFLVETTTKNVTNQRKVTDVRGAESSLDSTTLLHRCSLKPQSNVRLDLFDLTDELNRVSMKDGVMKKKEEEEEEVSYVPHALAFRHSYGTEFQKPPRREWPSPRDPASSCSTETVGVLVPPQEPSSLSLKETLFQRSREDQDQDQDQDLDAKITRRVQRAARRQAKREQLKRLHKAQTIQRQLQQVEERQRELEERGVKVERALRGEADYWEDSRSSPDLDLHLGGLGRPENPVLMQQWFQLVQHKNSLVRYEAQLLIFARELELEDRQSRLQQELRERMAVEDHLKAALQLAEERRILEEMLDVVEQRNALVALLEEQRVQNRQEDQDLEQILTRTGPGLSWT